ncbi:nuclear transport factor 2 family protein [Massilia sp. CFBP9012]|uniref:nuclear transport factor 2 family protein n=1 Tax=Massilia sp. CFBP9012 TaxID=3096531 RepID=UPI002A6AABAA|nr:nuclear transport factor 2 family protein [Massilia sp. CFBP9012]MDY0973453.1 nuclear transport factor 2 family protein [Massilia sp. CFBP9012]
MSTFHKLCLAALLMAAGTPCPLRATDASDASPAMKTETESANRESVRAAFQAWAEGTGVPFALLADDAQWTIVGRSLASRTYPDKAAFMHEVIHPFNARMAKPLCPTVRQLYADGDTVIVFFDAQGTALDGKPYVNTYTWIMEMRAGRALRVWAFFDAIEFNELWTRVKPANPPP